MKKFFVLFLFFVIAVTAYAAGDYKMFADKSGILTYEISGSKVGKVIICFDDYGRKMTIENNFSFNGTPNHSIAYVEGDTSYIYDKIKKRGYLYPYAEKREFMNLYAGIGDAEATYKAMYKNSEGTVVRSEKANGKKCDVWEIVGKAKIVWLWKTYRMKETYGASAATSATENLVKMEFDVKLPADQFKKPDVKYQTFTFQNIEPREE